MVYMATGERGRPETLATIETHFSAWLRKARQQKGWTGEMLADAVGCSQSMVSAYERGQRSPRRDRAVQLANALGADPQEALRALMADTPGLVQQTMKQASRTLISDIERIPFVDDAEEVAHLYSGIVDPRMRERIKELIRTAVEVTDREPPDAGPSGDGTD